MIIPQPGRPDQSSMTMLMPNAKFLTLPVAAIAIIAALPSPEAGSSRNEANAAVVTAWKTTDCDQRPVERQRATQIQIQRNDSCPSISSRVSVSRFWLRQPS